MRLSGDQHGPQLPFGFPLLLLHRSDKELLWRALKAAQSSDKKARTIPSIAGHPCQGVPVANDVERLVAKYSTQMQWLSHAINL